MSWSYRPRRHMREHLIIGTLVLAITAVLAVARLSSDPGEGALYALVLWPVAVLMWRTARLELVGQADGLLSRGTLRTTFTPWIDIAGLVPRGYGLANRRGRVNAHQEGYALRLRSGRRRAVPATAGIEHDAPELAALLARSIGTASPISGEGPARTGVLARYGVVALIVLPWLGFLAATAGVDAARGIADAHNRDAGCERVSRPELDVATGMRSDGGEGWNGDRLESAGRRLGSRPTAGCSWYLQSDEDASFEGFVALVAGVRADVDLDALRTATSGRNDEPIRPTEIALGPTVGRVGTAPAEIDWPVRPTTLYAITLDDGSALVTNGLEEGQIRALLARL